MRGIRQHVNPLGLKYIEPRAEPVQRPAHLPTDAPLDVELGCAEAKFSFDLASRDPHRFVVGLEIREAMVARNQDRRRRLGLDNLRFGYVNLNVDLDRVFAAASVDRFHLLFPDPWFKRRHEKRRVMTPELLEVIAHQLKPGGELHFASDVWEIGLEALAELEEAGPALGLHNVLEPWCFTRGNPYGVASRREHTTLARGQRVWRVIVRRT